MISVTSVQAQNSFGKLLDSVQREPVVVTRHGRPTAFLVSPQDMGELVAVRRKRGAALADLEAFFTESDKHLKPAAKRLTGADIARLVRESR